MAKFSIQRTNIEKPKDLKQISDFLFRCFDGANIDYTKSWRRLWKKLNELAPGDVVDVDFTFSRSTKYHKRHMAMESAVFDAQEIISDFETFRDWLKIGAGFVTWLPISEGESYPVPKSISYASLDQEEFEQFHANCITFLLGPHAPAVLWPHYSLCDSQKIMHSIVEGFL